MRGYCRTVPRGAGVVVQGTLEKGNHVLAHEVLAKHDENYTRRKWKRRMQEKPTAARNALIRTPHHDA